MGKPKPWNKKEKELCNWLIASLMLQGHGKLSGKDQVAISTLMTEIRRSGRYQGFDRSYNYSTINNYRFRNYRLNFEVPAQVAMPTRPDWLPIEFQLLGNDGFTYEDIDRCANLLRNASNVGEPSQVESNAKSKLYVEKSPQITGSPSTHPADGPTQRSPNTTHQRRLLPEYSQQARTSNNSGAAFDSAGMANPFKANASTIGLRPLSYYMGRTSASVASTGFGHTYTSDYSNHAQQPQNTFENKETAATNIIGEIAEGAALGINSSVFNGNPSSGIPFLPSWNFQSVTQDYNPATQAYGVQPVNTSEFSGTSLSYTIGSDTLQTPPFASTFEQFWNTQNFANNYPLAAYVPQVRPTGTELGCGQSDLL